MMQQYIMNYDVTWSNIMSLLLEYKLTDSFIVICCCIFVCCWMLLLKLLLNDQVWLEELDLPSAKEGYQTGHYCIWLDADEKHTQWHDKITCCSNAKYLTTMLQ